MSTVERPGTHRSRAGTIERASGENAQRLGDVVLAHHAGTHTSAELAELFSVARSTVYRAIERARTVAPVES
jgi:DNA-directed RNA polymerase specialized sigma24 family protein